MNDKEWDDYRSGFTSGMSLGTPMSDLGNQHRQSLSPPPPITTNTTIKKKDLVFTGGGGTTQGTANQRKLVKKRDDGYLYKITHTEFLNKWIWNLSDTISNRFDKGMEKATKTKYWRLTIISLASCFAIGAAATLPPHIWLQDLVPWTTMWLVLYGLTVLAGAIVGSLMLPMLIAVIRGCLRAVGSSVAFIGSIALAALGWGVAILGVYIAYAVATRLL